MSVPNCEYWVRDERGQHKCGEPSTHRYPAHAGQWFHVCTRHMEIAAEAVAKVKGKLTISKIYNPDER